MHMDTHDVDIACVRAAIERDAAALTKLFEFLAPVIQGRIAEVQLRPSCCPRASFT
jgi:hypothetical protein